VPCTAGNATARLAARCDAREAGSGKNASAAGSSAEDVVAAGATAQLEVEVAGRIAVHLLRGDRVRAQRAVEVEALHVNPRASDVV
jgi:hypothetical protein